MSKTGFITIAGVSERDTDLLLLEEIIASHDFTSWFVSQIGFVDAAIYGVSRRRIQQLVK